MATKFDIGKFDGTKFSLWKLKMKAILIKDNCLEAISGRPEEFTDDDKWIRMDAMAISDLHLALSDEILSGVEEKTTAKDIWDHLTKLYESKSLHNKIFLKRKLYTLRMAESTSVTEHIHTLTSLCSQLPTFPTSDQRGNVNGRLVLHDRYVNDKTIPAKGASVGLAPAGDVGSWQRECKSYQFWSIANEDGYFSINNIRSGNYNLYAFVPGFIGDYKYDDVITISPGSHANLDDLVYEPPRDGPTIWEIGIPDRSAAEFYIPDPNPKYINKLFVNHLDRFRQYGLWERYAELYPEGDLVFTVGASDYQKDWFFAQVTRKKDNNTYQGTTWQIKFKIDQIDKNGTYKLRLALATANVAQLQVRVNDPLTNPALFSTGVIGKDNTIARHGIHGLYYLYNVNVPGSLLLNGNNTILLTQTESISPFQGIMYDYIRLEGPPPSKS